MRRRQQFTVLIVEDEPDDQRLIEMAFRRAGASGPIHIVGDGLEAIAYMEGAGKYSDRATYQYPSFIITDLKMPRADGFAVLDFLKSNPEWAIIPTIVLTASSDPDDIRTSYMLGASSYHIKPAMFDEITTQIKILYDYWRTCEIPEVDTSGKQVRTDAQGKLGERFPQPPASQKTKPEK